MSVTRTITKQPAKVSLANNPVVFGFNVSGDAGETNIKLHLSLEMYIGGATEPVQSISLSARPDADNYVEFDVAALLQHADNYAFTHPADEIKGVVHSSLSSHFTVSYYVSYDGVDSALGGALSSLYYINGGISADDEGYLTAKSSDWWTWMQSQQLFLNFLPGAKRTVLQSAERLYWYAQRTQDETLQITWTAKDGTTGTISTTVAMSKYSIYELIVSPALVEAQMNGKTLARYTVKIVDFLGEQEYFMNQLSTINSTFFLFRNQYGVWEDMWVKGQHTATHNYDKTAIEQKPQLQDHQLVHGSSYIKNRLLQNGEVSTGILDGNDWVLWASDIISGSPVYLCNDDYIFPITVDTNSAKVGETPNYEFLYFIIKYTYSKRTKFPNRLMHHSLDIIMLVQEDGAIVTTEDGKIIIYA